MSRLTIAAYLRRRAAQAQRDTLVPYEMDAAAYWREEDRLHREKQARYAQNVQAQPAAGSSLPPRQAQEEAAQLDDFTVDSVQPPSPLTAPPQSLVSAPEPQAPPPLPDPPSMAQILEDISALIRRYLFCSEDQLTALALWVVHTYGFEYFSVTPYLSISSPENQSGKTVCMQLLRLLCHETWMPSGVTSARLINRVTDSQPTLLLDNWDTFFRASDAQSIVGFLNAGSAHGHRFVTRPDDRNDDWDSGASIHRNRKRYGYPVVTRPGNQEPDKSIFCPKAFAGQGRLPASLAARCIPIVLQRRIRTESDFPFWPDIVFQDAFRLVGPIPAWLEKNVGALRERALGYLRHPWSEIPRHQDDAVAPLLAIAEVAGGKWLRKAKHGLYRILSDRPPAPPTVGVQLLSDIRNFFLQENDPPKIHTTPLLQYLNGLEDRPWTERKTKRKLTPEGLARTLQDFPVGRSRNQRIDGKYLKGYTFRHFVESWDSYLPVQSLQQTTPVSTANSPPVPSVP